MIEISSIFVLFALLLQNFYLKQRPPLLQDSVLALFTLGILPLPFLSQAGSEKKRRRKILVHYYRRASFETRAKRGTGGRKKHDLNCAVELRIAARSISAVLSPT